MVVVLVVTVVSEVVMVIVVRMVMEVLEGTVRGESAAKMSLHDPTRALHNQPCMAWMITGIILEYKYK